MSSRGFIERYYRERQGAFSIAITKSRIVAVKIVGETDKHYIVEAEHASLMQPREIYKVAKSEFIPRTEDDKVDVKKSKK